MNFKSTHPDVRPLAPRLHREARVVRVPPSSSADLRPARLLLPGAELRRANEPSTDRHPFEALLPPLMQILHRRALQLTSDNHRAEDLVQATLLKAWANRDKYQPDTLLRAWLFTILRNTFFSDLRKRRREVEDVDGAHALALCEAPRQDDAIALKELMALIAELPEGQIRPLVLMGAYGYSQSEAADACGCTIGTIKSRVSRGRSTLHSAFGDEEAAQPGSPSPSRSMPRPSGPSERSADLAPMVERSAAS